MFVNSPLVVHLRMGPPPVVTGLSPKEATAGMKVTIRGKENKNYMVIPKLSAKALNSTIHFTTCCFPFPGENLGVSQQDLLGVLIHGCDCLLTTEWKSDKKLVSLCPGAAKEGLGDIVVATRSGGLGSCTVQLRVFRESVGPLKEVAAWTQEKFFVRSKRAGGFSSPGSGGPGGGGGGMEHEDALGLSVEGSEVRLPEEKLSQMFPGKSGDIGADNFDPAYFLLENHHGGIFLFTLGPLKYKKLCKLFSYYRHHLRGPAGRRGIFAPQG